MHLLGSAVKKSDRRASTGNLALDPSVNESGTSSDGTMSNPIAYLKKQFSAFIPRADKPTALAPDDDIIPELGNIYQDDYVDSLPPTRPRQQSIASQHIPMLTDSNYVSTSSPGSDMQISKNADSSKSNNSLFTSPVEDAATSDRLSPLAAMPTRGMLKNLGLGRLFKSIDSYNFDFNESNERNSNNTSPKGDYGSVSGSNTTGSPKSMLNVMSFMSTSFMSNAVPLPLNNDARESTEAQLPDQRPKRRGSMFFTMKKSFSERSAVDSSGYSPKASPLSVIVKSVVSSDISSRGFPGSRSSKGRTRGSYSSNIKSKDLLFANELDDEFSDDELNEDDSNINGSGGLSVVDSSGFSNGLQDKDLSPANNFDYNNSYNDDFIDNGTRKLSPFEESEVSPAQYDADVTRNDDSNVSIGISAEELATLDIITPLSPPSNLIETPSNSLNKGFSSPPKSDVSVGSAYNTMFNSINGDLLVKSDSSQQTPYINFSASRSGQSKTPILLDYGKGHNFIENDEFGDNFHDTPKQSLTNPTSPMFRRQSISMPELASICEVPSSEDNTDYLKTNIVTENAKSVTLSNAVRENEDVSHSMEYNTSMQSESAIVTEASYSMPLRRVSVDKTASNSMVGMTSSSIDVLSQTRPPLSLSSSAFTGTAVVSGGGMSTMKMLFNSIADDSSATIRNTDSASNYSSGMFCHS